ERSFVSAVGMRVSAALSVPLMLAEDLTFAFGKAAADLAEFHHLFGRQNFAQAQLTHCFQTRKCDLRLVPPGNKLFDMLLIQHVRIDCGIESFVRFAKPFLGFVEFFASLTTKFSDLLALVV